MHIEDKGNVVRVRMRDGKMRIRLDLEINFSVPMTTFGEAFTPEEIVKLLVDEVSREMAQSVAPEAIEKIKAVQLIAK